MSEPLNPVLFERLKRRFGRVKISNEGQAMVTEYHTLPSGFKKMEIISAGEYYCVSCPRCSDTRFRLYINHRWARRDPINGTQNLWLCFCQNEDCYANEEARLDLYEQVAGIDQVMISHAALRQGEVVTAARSMALPGTHYRLDRLPQDHPANEYLAGRFYDPEKLGRFYDVGYCPESHYYLARNRIVAPVYQDKVLKGWQARYIGDMDWKNPDSPPKWWSCPGMDRSKLLYNLDNAKQYRTGIAMEGFGDVWSLGPMGVACFGSTMTHFQQKLFAAAFAKGSGVILFDADVKTAKDKQTKTKLNKIEAMVADMRIKKVFRHGIALVWPPEGTDPGQLDRKFLRSYVADEAGKQGVKVDWRKW